MLTLPDVNLTRVIPRYSLTIYTYRVRYNLVRLTTPPSVFKVVNDPGSRVGEGHVLDMGHAHTKNLRRKKTPLLTKDPHPIILSCYNAIWHCRYKYSLSLDMFLIICENFQKQLQLHKRLIGHIAHTINILSGKLWTRICMYKHFFHKDGKWKA